MPTADPVGYRRQFEDDFLTDVPLGSFPSAVSSRWGSYTGWKDTSGAGVYRPEKVVSIHDGMLDMWLHTEGGEHCVAAPRPVPPLDRINYGRVAVRFYADKVPGYYTAWLMWPTSETWPRDGEIDFPEGGLTSTIKAFMHRQGATTGGDQDAYDSGKYHGAWHTAITDWTPSAVTFTLDDVVIGRATSRIPNTEMRWIAQTETAPGNQPTDAAQGHVLIDWVVIWETI